MENGKTGQNVQCSPIFTIINGIMDLKTTKTMIPCCLLLEMKTLNIRGPTILPTTTPNPSTHTPLKINTEAKAKEANSKPTTGAKIEGM